MGSEHGNFAVGERLRGEQFKAVEGTLCLALFDYGLGFLVEVALASI